MKNQLFIILMVATTFFTACNNSSAEENDSEIISPVVETPTIKPTKPIVQVVEKSPTNDGGSYLSEVDTASIKDFNDYYSLKNKLFSEYYNLKNKSFSHYYSEKNKAFSLYYQNCQSALKIVRESHYEKYLEWLDAEKMGNYEKQRQIENGPEFASYKKADKEGYAAYEKIEAAAYKEYERKEAFAYKIYEQKNN